jgi:serine/threonine protein kinase
MQYWQPNQNLKNGRFTIQKILGGGGYGVTYSAIDHNTGKIIATRAALICFFSRVETCKM